MGERPENHIQDMTCQALFAGTLTTNRNLTAVIHIDALVQPANVEADQTPGDSSTQLVSQGLFRITARDDGHPDPVHVAQLLFSMLSGDDRKTSVQAHWGNRCVGTVTQPRGRDGDMIATSFVLSPALVRQTRQYIAEATDAGAL